MSDSSVALITGGNRGIGLAIAAALGRRGLRIYLGSRDGARGAAAAAQLAADGIQAQAVTLDVDDESQRRDAIAAIEAEAGRLDVLVNNAGVALDKWVPARELPLDVLRRTMETNLYAPLHLSQLALPGMIARGHGRIVNLSSELGSLAECTMGSSAAYRASKTALNMLTRLLALELAEQPDVLVNAAAPGWVRTELGGAEATRTPEEGARTPVWLATLPAGGPSGGFFRDEAPYPW